MMCTTPPKSSLVKLGFYPRHKTLKVMVLGQAGVGKSGKYICALRFSTYVYLKLTEEDTVEICFIILLI